MSDYKFVIELIFDIQTKTIQKVPLTVADLKSEILSSFSISGVSCKYMDEEGDLITISSDSELLESYQILKDLQIPVFKILVLPDESFKKHDLDIEIDEKYIKTVTSLVRTEMEKSLGYDKNKEPVWENITCDGCAEYPITGLRFKCTVCDNFDFCEFCEMSSQHPHPFLKLSTLDHNIDMIKVALNKPISNFKKAMILKKPKMKFLSHVSYSEGEKVRPGQKMEKIWKVKNIGNEEWPVGCKVKSVKGDLDGVGYEIGTVKSGDSIDLIATIVIPSAEGRYTGVWRLFTPDNVSFGDKLYVVIQSLCNQDVCKKDLNYLLELGFAQDNAIRSLKLFPNDLQAAVRHLVNN